MTLRKLKAEGALLAIGLVLLAFASNADADTRGDELTNNAEIVTNVGAGDNTAWNLSPAGLGDVDISGCWGSTQVSVFIFFARQKLVLDPLCVAREYDRAGKHEKAAELRCLVPEIAGLDYAGTTCIEANTFGDWSIEETPPPAAFSIEPEPELEAEPEEEAEDHDRAIAALRAEFERDQANRRAAARRQAQAEAAEAEYAQQVLEEWRQVEQPPATEEPEQ